MGEDTRAGQLAYSVVLILITAVAVKVLLPKFTEPNLPIVVHGSVEVGFESVQDELRKLFEEGLEENGAAFSVYYKGKSVVDIWGGYADRSTAYPWKQDTMSLFFSTSKGMGALAVAVLVDRGHLSYDDLVTKHWPKFGQNGKDNVTVSILLSHQAGLSSLDEGVRLTIDDLNDHEKIGDFFANQRPQWPPGTAHGYHAFTQGWLVNQLVMRTDPKKRTVGQFFKEEIADPFGIEFYIGVPKSEIHRIARIQTKAFSLSSIKDMFYWFYNWYMAGSRADLAKRALSFDTIKLPGDVTDIRVWNNVELMSDVEVPAVNGIGTARSQAKIYGIIANGGKYDKKTLLKPETIAKLEECIDDNNDLILSHLGLNARFSSGGFYCGKAFTFDGLKGIQLYGSPGYGLQLGAADSKTNVGFGYLTNTLVSVIDTRYQRLVTKTYECINKLRA